MTDLLAAAPRPPARPGRPPAWPTPVVLPETPVARALPETPYLSLDTGVVTSRYAALAAALPGVALHYAVKANPSSAVLGTLGALGCRWDVASPGEVDAARRAGAEVGDMSYGNTVKRARDIERAHAAGIDRFTLDAPAELDKLLRLAPGATLMVRLHTSGEGAGWSLSSKFGCEEAAAARLLDRALDAGHRVGVAFHVGSQQHDPSAWEAPLRATGRLRAHVRRRGTDLAVVNLGGGFPAEMFEPTPPIETFGAAIRGAVARSLGPDLPALMAEPGRFLVADAGTLESEVVLVAERGGARWVYLDVGVFSGLVETLGEALRYRLEVHRDGRTLGGRTGEAVLAGPTCDSLDVLYAERRYRLPLDVRPGDRVVFRSAGAYTLSCTSAGFNGFPPLRQLVR